MAHIEDETITIDNLAQYSSSLQNLPTFFESFTALAHQTIQVNKENLQKLNTHLHDINDPLKKYMIRHFESMLMNNETTESNLYPAIIAFIANDNELSTWFNPPSDTQSRTNLSSETDAEPETHKSSE